MIAPASMSHAMTAVSAQVVDHRLARLAESLRGAVQKLAVADLVLHLGHERHLAAEAGSARDPRAFGERADDLGVRVLLDHADELAAVLGRHPIVRLDLLAAVDTRLEHRELLRVVGDGVGLGLGIDNRNTTVHRVLLECERSNGGRDVNLRKGETNLRPRACEDWCAAQRLLRVLTVPWRGADRRGSRPRRSPGRGRACRGASP